MEKYRSMPFPPWKILYFSVIYENVEAIINQELPAYFKSVINLSYEHASLSSFDTTLDENKSQILH